MNPLAWIAAAALASSVVSPDETVQCRQAALADGARVETCHVVWGRRKLDWGPGLRSQPERYHELTVVLKQDAEDHLLARYAIWKNDVTTWGGASHTLPVTSAALDGVYILEVVSKPYPSTRSVTIFGWLVPLSRRTSPAEWLPIDAMRSSWVVDVGTGLERREFDDVQASFEKDLLRVLLLRGGDIMVDLVIDPVGCMVQELHGLPVTAKWERGAKLDMVDPTLGQQPLPESEAPPER